MGKPSLRLLFVGLGLAMAGLGLPAGATASGSTVTIGATDLSPSPNGGLTCPSTCLYWQAASPTTPSELITAPSDGVLVKWRVHAYNAGGNASLRVVRPLGGGSFTALDDSA